MTFAFSPPNDTGSEIHLIDQIARLVRAQKDAEKADVYCQSDDFEHCWSAVKTEKIELRRLLINAGIDWITFERAFS